MKRLGKIIGLIGLIGLSSCQQFTPSGYRGLPREYSVAYEEDFGAFYDSVPYGVVGLDLYTEDLSFDADKHITGTGYNLCLTDIFVSDTRLEPGIYHSDTSAQAFTFLPGHDYEGTPHGIYLLSIEESKVKSIQIIDSGYIEVRDTTNSMTDLQFTLYYRNSYGGRATYRTHFQGVLEPWQNQ